MAVSSRNLQLLLQIASFYPDSLVYSILFPFKFVKIFLNEFRQIYRQKFNEESYTGYIYYFSTILKNYKKPLKDPSTDLIKYFSRLRFFKEFLWKLESLTESLDSSGINYQNTSRNFMRISWRKLSF